MRIMSRETVENRYRQAMNRLNGPERLARTSALFASGWELVRKRVLARNPNLSPEEIKIEVARIMYRRDPQVQTLLRSRYPINDRTET